jgi:hypothetical protein
LGYGQRVYLNEQREIAKLDKFSSPLRMKRLEPRFAQGYFFTSGSRHWVQLVYN